MANTSISNLTAGGAVSGTDLFPDVQTVGVGPVKVTATQIKTFIVGAGSVSVASGKTLTVNNTLTLAGTDGTTMTFPTTSATLAGLGIANVFTQPQTFQPSIDGQAGTFRRLNGTQTSNILELQTEANAFLAGFDKSGLLTLGAASTQTGILKMAGTTSGTVSLSVADAAGTWTMKLPNSGGTNGFILTTDGSGNTSWTNPTALGIDLDVGSTAITNGTAGRLLFEGTGNVLQESANLTWDNTNRLLTVTGLGTGGSSNTGGLTVSGGPFGLAGNISANAWTTSGIRYRNVAATITDLTSTGTVATAYTDLFGGNTIAASNATTFTNYYTSWFNAPTAGTNVTFTGRWAMGLGGSLDIQAGTVTTNTTPALNLTQTWNAGAVTFTGLKFNATDTASASGSLLLDLQTGAASQFRVRKDGYFTTNGAGMQIGTAFTVQYTAAQVTVSSVFRLGWGSSDATSSQDLSLTRAAAATLQLGAADAAAPVAQTLQVQSVVAGTSNTAGTNFTINGSKGTGTGAGGSIIFQVAPAGSSGTAQNAYATALTIASDKNVTIASGGSLFTDGYVGLNASNAYYAVSNSLYFVAAGATQFNVANGYVTIGGFSGGGDCRLYRDAANTLALRNGTSAQTFRVYGTTSGGNSSFLSFYADPIGYTSIYNDTTGSGTFGSMFIVANAIRFQTGTSYAGRTARWQINDSGHFIAETDNTYDIGASGANRPRNVFVAGRTSIGSPSALQTSTTYGLAVAGSTTLPVRIVSEFTGADSTSGGGVFIASTNSGNSTTTGSRLGLFLFSGNTNGTLNNSSAVISFASENWSATAAGSRFEFATTANTTTTRTTRLIIGNSGVITFGATEANTVPALKPSSTTPTLQVRLGDDSAFGSFQTGGFSGGAPTIKTANYTQLEADYSLIFNGTGSITLTLLAAATYPGKILYVKTIAAQTVVSASSNVKPIDTDTAGTAILAATAGKWAMLQSDGTDWVIMAQG